MRNNQMVIVIADDDEEDQLLAREALEENKIANQIYFVSDGEELMDYLYNRGKYSDTSIYKKPGIILLDLNMPKKDGREALMEIKSDDKLKGIPVVILSTSKAEEDVIKSYDIGVNSFITKPVSFDGLVEVMRSIKHYWIEIVEFPNK